MNVDVLIESIDGVAHSLAVGDRVYCVDGYTANGYPYDTAVIIGIRLDGSGTDAWLMFDKDARHVEHLASYWKKVGRHESN